MPRKLHTAALATLVAGALALTGCSEAGARNCTVTRKEHTASGEYKIHTRECGTLAIDDDHDEDDNYPAGYNPALIYSSIRRGETYRFGFGSRDSGRSTSITSARVTNAKKNSTSKRTPTSKTGSKTGSSSRSGSAPRVNAVRPAPMVRAR